MKFSTKCFFGFLIFSLITFTLIFLFVRNVNNYNEIPRIYFYGDITGMTKKNDIRNIEIEYRSNNYNFNGYAIIKLQGRSSLNYSKKNYNITLYDDSDYKKNKYVDVKWGKQSKYTLKANWIDKTHSRNIVSANIASQIQKKYGLFNDCINNGLIDGFPVEVYINKTFLGLYTLNIHKKLLFKTDDNNSMPIVLNGKSRDDVTNFRREADNSWLDFEVEYGSENEYTLNKLNRLINFVNTSSDEEFVNEFEKYFNLDSVLNYYCFMRFANLVDNSDNNLFLVTYDGNIWYTCLYDLDTSFGTSWDGKSLLDFTYMMTKERTRSKLWSRLEKNFPNHIVIRYNELRKDFLNEKNIMTNFDNFVSSIPKSSYKKEQNKYTYIPGYNISTIQSFLSIHTPLLDNDINKLKDSNYNYVYNMFSIDNKENDK